MITGFKVVIGAYRMAHQDGVDLRGCEIISSSRRRPSGHVYAFQQHGSSEYNRMTGGKDYTPGHYGVALTDEAGVCVAVWSLPEGLRTQDGHGRTPRQRALLLAQGMTGLSGVPVGLPLHGTTSHAHGGHWVSDNRP